MPRVSLLCLPPNMHFFGGQFVQRGRSRAKWGRGWEGGQIEKEGGDEENTEGDNVRVHQSVRSRHIFSINSLTQKKSHALRIRPRGTVKKRRGEQVTVIYQIVTHIAEGTLYVPLMSFGSRKERKDLVSLQGPIVDDSLPFNSSSLLDRCAKLPPVCPRV